MPRPQVQILVCVNERPPDARKPSCGPRGSLEVYRRFKDRVRELGLRDGVMVNRTGCLKHCSRGITVAIWPYNVWYSQAMPKRPRLRMSARTAYFTSRHVSEGARNHDKSQQRRANHATGYGGGKRQP